MCQPGVNRRTIPRLISPCCYRRSTNPCCPCGYLIIVATGGEQTIWIFRGNHTLQFCWSGSAPRCYGRQISGHDGESAEVAVNNSEHWTGREAAVPAGVWPYAATSATLYAPVRVKNSLSKERRRCRCRYQGLVERRHTVRLDADHPDRRSGRERRRSSSVWQGTAGQDASLSAGIDWTNTCQAPACQTDSKRKESICSR